MWKVFVWLESSESGWQEDRWVGRCCRTNELFSHRNNFHGKIPQTIVLSPIQANIWCSFCRSVSSSSMGAIKAHIGPNIHIYMSTLHCPQCPGVHINSLQKGYIFEYRFLNHTKYFFNFLTLMMVSFIVSCCCCCYHFVYLGIIFVVIIFIDFMVVIYHSYNICFPHVLVFAILAAVECWDNFWADFHNAGVFPLGWVSVLRLPYPSCRPGGGIFSK